MNLTPEQRTILDDRVLSCICAGTSRQQLITEQLSPWLKETMPPRLDLFRYVDQSIVRLKRAGKIKRVTQGLGWWSAVAS
jgi:hypothetical protein